MNETFTNIAQRYVALWNEDDDEARRAGIEGLFAPEAVHYTPTLVASSYDELEVRIATAFTNWVAEAGYRFDLVGTPLGHHEGVLLRWQMTKVKDGDPLSIGTDFLQLNGDGMIERDYQFIL